MLGENMVEIIIAIVGVIGTIVSSIVAYKKSNKISKLTAQHEKEMEKMKSEYILELEKQKNVHDKDMQDIKHAHEMEKLKFKTELNANSGQGINDILKVMQSIGMDPQDLVNNPEKINKQINNVNNLSFSKKK